MSIRITPTTRLRDLKREAKRWLKALRKNDAASRIRLESALPSAPPSPTLRDVQLALARELGFPGWPALKKALEHNATGDLSRTTLERYERMAANLLDACG